MDEYNNNNKEEDEAEVAKLPNNAVVDKDEETISASDGGDLNYQPPKKVVLKIQPLSNPKNRMNVLDWKKLPF